MAPTLRLVLRDYLRQASDGSTVREPAVDRAVHQLNQLSADALVDVRTVAEVLSLPAALADQHAGVEPRGYRLLHRLPRFSDVIIERIVDRFLNLQQIMRASLSDLEKVEGVGVAKARSVKDGLARLAEASILERYQ